MNIPDDFIEKFNTEYYQENIDLLPDYGDVALNYLIKNGFDTFDIKQTDIDKQYKEYEARFKRINDIIDILNVVNLQDEELRNTLYQFQDAFSNIEISIYNLHQSEKCLMLLCYKLLGF